MYSPLASPRLLKPGWVVFAVFTLYPLWWGLGLGGFVWGLAAFPLWVLILLRHRIVMPPTTWLFAMYIGWSLVTIVRLDRMTRYLSFGFRFGALLTSLGLAIYVFNERRVTRRRFIRWVAWLWVAGIVGGYLGLLMPYGRINTTLASVLLPRAVTNNEFVGHLVRPGFAQVQNLFGVAVPRPSTLFPYTNEWGGNVGLLTPFFIASFLYSPSFRERRFGAAMLILAAPPMLLSVNRGLWISVGVILVVVALRSFVQGNNGPIRVVAGAVVLVAVVLAFTPLGEVVNGRLSETDAGTRANIYREAWEGARESPVLGWGGPRPSANPFAPSIGTHGHFWLVMFANGFVGLALYLSCVLFAIRTAWRPRDPVSTMLACVVIIGGLQMFFYNLLPASLPIILVAVGLMTRPTEERTVVSRLPLAAAASHG